MLRKPINAEVKLRELLSATVAAMRNEITTKPYAFDVPLNASGNAASLLDFRLTDSYAEIIGAGYTFQMKFGREPGKPPPSSVIMQWLDDKQIAIPERLTKKSFAFLIARKIGREGTFVYRKGGIPLFEDILNQDFINRIAGLIIEMIGTEIRLTFTETLKQ